MDARSRLLAASMPTVPVTLHRERRLRHDWHFSSVTACLALSFQEIVTDVVQCHNVLIGNYMALNPKVFMLQRRCIATLSSDVSNAEGATHGGCEQTSMPLTIMRYRFVSSETCMLPRTEQRCFAGCNPSSFFSLAHEAASQIMLQGCL